MLRTLSALVLGVAVSAGAARPSAETGFSLEASKRIRAEHESLCGRLAAALDSIEALRNAYPTAADPDAHLSRWAEARTAGHALLASQDELAKAHQAGRDSREVSAISRAFARTAAGKGAAEREPLDLPAIQANDEAIQLRKRRLVNRFWDDNKIYGPAVEARARSRREEGRHKETLRLVLAAAAALVLAAAVAAWAVRR